MNCDPTDKQIAREGLVILAIVVIVSFAIGFSCGKAAGGEYTPTIAAAGGYADVAVQDSTPPDIGNICTDCNGKGWNGDGTHRYKCEACDGTGKRTTTASVAPALSPTSTESQQPEVSDSLSGASTSAPEEAEEQEAPPIEPLRDPLTDDLRLLLPTPEIQPTYAAACDEATRTRELLIVTYADEDQRAKAIRWLDSTAAAKRFVWLLKPGAAPSVQVHNVVTNESRRIHSAQDLEE